MLIRFIKFFGRLILLLCITVIIFTSSVIYGPSSYSQFVLKKLLTLGLRWYEVSISIRDLRLINLYHLDIISATARYKGAAFDIKDLSLTLSNLFSSQYATMRAVGDFVGYFGEENLATHMSLLYNYSHKHQFGEMTLNNVNYSKYVNVSGRCRFSVTASQIGLSECFVKEDDMHLSFDLNIANSEVKGHAFINNLPLLRHKHLIDFIPNVKLRDFLHRFVLNGIIENGEIELLPRDPYGVYGKLRVRNASICYNPDYPIIDNLMLDVDAQGSNIKFTVYSGRSGNFTITSGTTVVDENMVNISVKGRGPIADVVRYVSAGTLQNLSSHGLTLSKLRGDATTDVSVIVPLYDSDNIYNIQVHVHNLAWNIFNDAISLKNASLTGSFLGNKLIVSGSGKINSLNSKINYQHNFLTTSEFDDILHVSTTIPMSLFSNVVTFDDKPPVLDLSYKVKNSNGILNIASDLTATHVDIGSLGIRKLKGRKAHLNAQAILEKSEIKPLTFKISGDDNLHISGMIKDITNPSYIRFDHIKYDDTDIKLIIKRDATNRSKIKITGSLLDLSQYSVRDFMGQSKVLSTYDVLAQIDTLKLKQDVECRNFHAFILGTSNDRCGYEVHTNIFDKLVEIACHNVNGLNEITLKSSNAGAMLSGLDIYNNMQNGALTLNITENAGIKEGTFLLENFTVNKTPIITKLVSFISIHGFINTILNNNTISFSRMSGAFTWHEDVFKVRDVKAEGPFFDFTAKGTIDTLQRKIKIHGQIAPSLYGLSIFLKKAPILRWVFAERNLIFAPYSLEHQY